MKKDIQPAALFDLDGVIMDTESQYSVFWNRQGEKYLEEKDFGRRIKGQTLKQIFDGYFQGRDEVQEQIRSELERFEQEMSYAYIPGFPEFLADLRRQGVRTAVVTSSNTRKMENVYRAHPDFTSLFDVILTAEDFTRSKPDPECFRVAMQCLGCSPENSVVFEDSFHGLTAGRGSGAWVVGLATTNSRDSISEKCDLVWDNFTGKDWNSLKQELQR
ncbi:MAG: HAD family phosphatase [Bacteroides sp.]|nr:HAD family phosphatase [Bacteroides sp.]